MPNLVVRSGMLAVLAVVAGLASGSAASAQSLGGGSALGIPGYTPRVPVSGLASPGWFDRSRLHITNTMTVGTGFGQSSEALNVTRLSYQFGAPLWMAVSVGNRWSSSPSARSGNSFFLEGMDVAYRPHPSVLFQVQYRDMRSPLQRSGYGIDPYYTP